MRGEVLAKEARGQSYIALYEKHSPEAAVILLRDEKLRRQAKELLLEMEPALRSLVDEKAEPVVVKAEQVTAADAVLAGLQARASSELAVEIERWRKRLPEFEAKTAWEIWILVSE